MTKEDQGITTRRGFLKAAALTAAAATVAGGGAAVVGEELGLLGGASNATPLAAINASTAVSAPVISVQPSAVPAVQRVVTSSNPTALVSDLAAATGDKTRLESELNAARERIALLESSLNEQSDARAKMQIDLDNSMSQIGVLGGLVALYEQLDEVDVTDFVQDGLSQVGATISGIVDDIPGVQEGLVAGRAALDNLENEIPLVEGGRIWLLANVARMQGLFATVLGMLAVAVDSAEPLIDMMAAWATRVLRWLPFGFGERSADLIEAMTALLDAVPDSVDGAQVNVAQPLELWLGKADEADIPLLSKVVVPMRDGILNSAENHLNKTGELRTQFSAKVQEPIALAQENRNRIRASIDAYREQNAI